jgi:hypothetical protein
MNYNLILLLYNCILASFRTEVTDEALKDYVPAAIGVGKLRLAEAIAKYEQDNTLV